MRYTDRKQYAEISDDLREENAIEVEAGALGLNLCRS